MEKGMLGATNPLRPRIPSFPHIHQQIRKKIIRKSALAKKQGRYGDPPYRPFYLPQNISALRPVQRTGNRSPSGTSRFISHWKSRDA